ncbi:MULTISPECIES: SDR family NAD(P)-dependent oxidoreductase [Bacillus]|uniref:SDR family NAD(P)-dependent oxidoreductase n=1 Tax=Bacillus TaxID=1386 RepID=UPI000BB868EE|nr:MULTISPECIES: SDR family NAD(P)-dependent oxidoreductase [Bacillus]
MKNRIVVITGANSGIGKAAAKQFAKEGYTVIMACRNIEVSRKSQEEIVTSTNNTQVELMKLDVSSFESMYQFADEFKSKYEKLDILIHNAAYFNHGAKHTLTPEGIELTFATNVVGPYLLTNLLLDHLKKSDDARILNAGSNIIKHFFEPKREIDFDNVTGEYKSSENFTVYKMYCQSKMALMMLTFKMAEEYESEGIKVNALQINGAKMSKETLKKVTPGYRMVASVQNLFFRQPSYMANNYYEICTSDRFKDKTGKLFNDKLDVMKPALAESQGFLKQIKQVVGTSKYPAYAENKEIRSKVWELCKDLTESNPSNQEVL